MIVAIYARKSTDDSDRNEEARSITRQVERATEYAKKKGWAVDPRYIFTDDAVSGAEWKHRPGFNALLAALEPRPPFGVLVVSELSRIGRDTVRTPFAVLQLEEAGVEIRSYLSDAPITLADESGEIHTIFNSLAASFERRRARQRTYDALRRRAEVPLGARRPPAGALERYLREVFGGRDFDGRHDVEQRERHVLADDWDKALRYLRQGRRRAVALNSGGLLPKTGEYPWRVYVSRSCPRRRSQVVTRIVLGYPPKPGSRTHEIATAALPGVEG